MNLPPLIFALVCNDKGGVGKSLFAALLTEAASASGRPIDLVEIEQHVEFTQRGYSYPANVKLTALPLVARNEVTDRTEPSLTPLDALWDLIPSESNRRTGSIVIVDCGAAAFQSLLLWGVDQRGLKPFRDAGYQFVSFLLLQAGDSGAARFVQMNTSLLHQFGPVALVKNLRAGPDFSMLDPNLLATLPSLSLIYRGRPLSDHLQTGATNHTFRQVAANAALPRRPRVDAEDCAAHFSAQLADLLTKLGITT